MGSRLLRFVVLLLLTGDLFGATVGELVYCIDGERSLLQCPLADTTCTIFPDVRRESDRRRARHCVWEIQPPEGQSGTLLLQLRHRTRPVAAGVDFMSNLTCTLHQRGTTKSIQFPCNSTVFTLIWMNRTDKLELRFTVDNTSAVGMDDLYLVASFATKNSCSDSSQLHYNGTCYMVYRPSNDSNTSSSKDQVFNSAIPLELAAGFKTVDELLEFSKQGLKLLNASVLLIPGIRVPCNGTQLLHLITTDDAECKWTPMDGNMSSMIQWSTNLTQSSCHFLTLLTPTELGKRHTFGCVSSDEASQLPQLLAVSSSERRPLDGPQLPAYINGCRSSIIDSCQPHEPGSDTANKSIVVPLVLFFAVLLSVALIIALTLGICVWKRRRTRCPGSAASGGKGVGNGASGAANGHGNGGAEEQVPLQEGP